MVCGDVAVFSNKLFNKPICRNWGKRYQTGTEMNKKKEKKRLAKTITLKKKRIEKSKA